jgi:hypothetical protein
MQHGEAVTFCERSAASENWFVQHLRTASAVDVSLTVPLDLPQSSSMSGASDDLGQCRLCSRISRLRKSHYIPAGIYRTLRYKNLHPILSSPNIVASSSKQLRVPLLCEDCEQRFNNLGEKWVQARMARDFDSFALRDLLCKSVKPIEVKDGSQIYVTADIPEIDATKITYFALSVFWRGAVHDWQGLNGLLPRIPLDDFEQPIRQFLLGKAGLPKHMALNVLLWPRKPWLPASYAPLDSSTAEYGNFHFYIPGIHFELFTGRKIPDWVKSMCFATNPQHPILISEKFSNAFLRHLQRQAAQKPGQS